MPSPRRGDTLKSIFPTGASQQEVVAIEVEKRLEIALVTTEYPPDPMISGIATYTQSLALALAEKGHRVHVLSRGPESVATEADGRITVYRIGPERFDYPEELHPLQSVWFSLKILFNEYRYRRKLARQLASLIREQGVELVESADVAAEALFIARPRSVPFIVRLHGPFSTAELFEKRIPEYLRRIIRVFERRLVHKATHLSSPSSNSLEVIRREMLLRDRAIKVLPNPPPFSVEACTAAEATTPNQVLYLGRLHLVKGLDVLMRAVPLVLKRHPDARFVIVGNDASIDGERLVSGERFLAMVPGEYHHAVHFAGRVPHSEVADFYRNAALCVFPSQFEPFGYTCLEAMSFGKAIVGSRNGGMLELLDEGRAGLLYTPPRAEELADHIVRLLKDPELRAELGEKARQRALMVYNRDRVIEETISYYRSSIRELAATGT